MNKTHHYRCAALIPCRYGLAGMLVYWMLGCQQPSQRGMNEPPMPQSNRALPIKATNVQERAQAWAESDEAKAAFLQRHPSVTKLNWDDQLGSGNLETTDSFRIEPGYALIIERGIDSLESYGLHDAADSVLFRQRYREDFPIPPPLGSPQAEVALKAAYEKAFNMRKALLGQPASLAQKAMEESEATEKAAWETYLKSKARPTQ